VRVLNGTGVDGLGSQVEQRLLEGGFVVTGTGNPGARQPTATTVYHGPGQAAHAEELASVLSAAQIEEVPDLGTELELVMGADDWGPITFGGDGGGGSGALAELEGTSAADDTVSCE
ncbi:LytR C-terminal domain-containing protein, partial [Nocardiopsis tropica]|nr:LytR C-terminal domain-containing protein [Nocardiopsis tropica]